MATQGFQYKYGDRPLEGYTIQRAAGRGGFGEVYYALSDSGREVAIKVVNSYEQIEIRGISQCMNLKSPHLVTIFDVKHNDQGRPFVVMEYISGPSLHGLIDESPGGLGVQKSSFFLREIGKGLTFLHDRGIVHRDLKPGNIFYENGYVMIGDYGLSKVINTTRHTGQTITVGTVHYMAPEIGDGVYDKTIDIYALGAVLYEMLTGQVPFVGSSVGEILMKHLSRQVETSDIEEPFAEIIQRAMAKNPADRYQTVQEMVEAVFGAEHIRNSVSHFAPDSLTMVAGRAARQAHREDDVPDDLTELKHQMKDHGRQVGRLGRRMGDIGRKMAQRTKEKVKNRHRDDDVRGDPADDPLILSQRSMLAVMTALSVAAVVGMLTMDSRAGGLTAALLALTTIFGAAVGIVAGARRLLPGLTAEKGVVTRIAFGGLGCIGAMTLSLPIIIGLGQQTVVEVGIVLLALFVMDWTMRTKPNRKHRVSFDHAFQAGLFGMVLSFVFDASTVFLIAVLTGLSLVVETLSPLAPRLAAQPPANQRRRKVSLTTSSVSSPHRRLWALLLAAGLVLGVGGLQRFYVRKIGTGIIWLLTGGLLGIGQLYDIIMIAMGRFRDKDGRLLVTWLNDDELAGFSGSPEPIVRQPQDADQAPAVDAGPEQRDEDDEPPAEAALDDAYERYNRAHAPGSQPVVPTRQTSWLLTSLGALIMLVAVVIGLLCAFNVPGLIQADIPPGLGRELERDIFGTSAWPGVVHRLGEILTILIMLIAVVVLIVARRCAGCGHMLRAAVGASGLLLALNSLRDALGRVNWFGIVEQANSHQVAAAIETFLNAVRRNDALLAGALFLAAVFVLAWPERRMAYQLGSSDSEGDGQ